MKRWMLGALFVTLPLVALEACEFDSGTTPLPPTEAGPDGAHGDGASAADGATSGDSSPSDDASAQDDGSSAGDGAVGN